MAFKNSVITSRKTVCVCEHGSRGGCKKWQNFTAEVWAQFCGHDGCLWRAQFSFFVGFIAQWDWRMWLIMHFRGHAEITRVLFLSLSQVTPKTLIWAGNRDIHAFGVFVWGCTKVMSQVLFLRAVWTADLGSVWSTLNKIQSACYCSHEISVALTFHRSKGTLKWYIVPKQNPFFIETKLLADNDTPCRIFKNHN